MSHVDRTPPPDDFDRFVANALRRHVRDVEADAGLLERLRHTAGGDASARRWSRRAPAVLIGAAAAVIVVAFLALSGRFDGDDPGVVTDGVTDRTDGTDGTDGDDGTTADDEPTAAVLPDRAILARTSPDGLSAELVLVDLSDGTQLATIDTIDNRACTGDEPEACRMSYASTAVSAAHDVFIERCCEPAGGDVPRYPDLDPDTGSLGEPQPFLGGFFPSVDPDGSRVATAGLTGIVIRDLDGDAGDHMIDLDDGAVGPATPTGLAWSPDGRSLAVSVADPDGGRVVIVPDDAGSLDDGDEVTSGETYAVQAWTSNDRLWVLDTDGGSLEPGDRAAVSPVRALEPDTGRSTEFEVQAHQVVADRTGTHLYVVTRDGVHRGDAGAQTSDGLVQGERLLVPAGDDVLGALSVFVSETSA